MTDPAALGLGTTPGLSITRVFDASTRRIWREWTEPSRFADWFGGVDSEIPLDTVALDVRPGGSWRATMYAGPDRREIRWSGEYREVVEPHRLVFTISDQSGGAAYELVVVELTELDGGRTQQHFEQWGRMTPAQYGAAGDGWGTFFARLDERLAAE